MNIIDSSLIKKYTINISSAINKIYKLGDRIHIYNVDDINTDGIDIIVTSIQYSRDDIKVKDMAYKQIIGPQGKSKFYFNIWKQLVSC